jgi:hypothetical protein
MSVNHRARTTALAVAATVALVPFSLWGLRWVRDTSGSLAVDFAVIVSWVVLAMGAGWLQAAAALGPAPAAAPARGRDDAGDLVPPAPWRWPVVLRSVLIVVATLANLYWSNAAAGDFWFGHYGRYGALATELRSPDPDDRRRAIARFAELASPVLADLVGRVAAMQDDPDPVVRADAIAAMGHVVRRMRLSVALLQAEGGVTDRWEPAALRAARAAAGDPSGGIRTATGDERRAWIMVAGALGEAANLGLLQAIVEDPRSTFQEVVEAIAAIADVPGGDALAALRPALSASDGAVRAYGAWAVAMTAAALVRKGASEAEAVPEFGAVERLLARVLPRIGVQAQCAYLGVFPRIADARMTEALIATAGSPAMRARCERMERKPWFGRPDVVVADGPMSDLVVASMASIAMGNAELRRFLEDAVDNDSLEPGVRAALRGVLDQVRAGGGP